MIAIGHLHEGSVQGSGELLPFFEALTVFVHVVAGITILRNCQNKDGGVPEVLLSKGPETSMNFPGKVHRNCPMLPHGDVIEAMLDK